MNTKIDIRIMARIENRKRNDLIKCRVTKKEKEKFLSLCTAAGISQGDYIRVKCLGEKPLRARPVPTVKTKSLALLLTEIKRVGNNINQIARVLNSRGEISPEEKQAMYRHLKDMRDLVFKKLSGS